MDLAYNHDRDIGDQKEIEGFWNKNLVAHTIVKQGGHGWYDLFENDGPSSFKMDINSVITNPEFENIVVNRIMLLYSAKKRLYRVQKHIMKLLNFIERHYTL